MTVQATKRAPQYAAALAAAGGAFAVGIGLGWSSPAQAMLVDEVQYFPISLSEFSWISSMITLGCAISCLPVGLLMNKYGRKTTMLSLVLPFTIGWVLVIWAQNFTMLCIGRLLIGIAGGAFCIAAPQYTAEIAEKEIRGTLSSFFQLMMVTGILFVYCVGAGLDVIWFSVIGLIIPLVFGCIFFIMPESPTYLVNEGKVDAAIVSFKWLRGQSYDPSIEIDNLKAELLEKNQNDMSFIDTLKLTANKKALLIGFGLMFFQQLSGVNIVIFYVSDIFKTSGSGLSPDLGAIIVGLMHVLATGVSAIVVDRLGRKLLLTISISVVILCLVLLGIFFFMLDQDASSVSNIGWLPILSLSVYIIAFALGFGPVPWVMLGEVYSSEMKPFASPLSGAFNWFLAFLITYFFQGLSDAIGKGETFWLFAVISVIGLCFVLFIVPETKGKSLAEIQIMLSGGKTIENSAL